jgi:hypothetical protein
MSPAVAVLRNLRLKALIAVKAPSSTRRTDPRRMIFLRLALVPIVNGPPSRCDDYRRVSSGSSPGIV